MKKTIFFGALLCTFTMAGTCAFGQLDSPTMYKGTGNTNGSSGSYFGSYCNATGLHAFSGGHDADASGIYSMALGTRLRATNSHAIALGIDLQATNNRSIVIGSGVVGNPGMGTDLVNNIQHSMMVGFNSDLPTFFVGGASGLNTIGNVGIGTSAPSALLEIKGVADNPNFKITNAQNQTFEFGVADCNGCYSTFSKPGDGVVRVLGGGDLIFAIPGTNASRKIAFQSGGSELMTIQEVGTSGKVGIGTSNFPTTIGGANIAGYKLFVEGGILAEELRVNAGWADYVFENDYKLMPLTKVEEFISQNGHLPNVPSATVVEKEGISVGDMTRIQQEKIEELTLYIIEQNKKIDTLAEEIEKLKK